MADGNGFTNKELLLRLEAKVDKVIDIHEARIGALETFVNRIKGGAKTVGALIAFGVPIAALLISKF